MHSALGEPVSPPVVSLVVCADARALASARSQRGVRAELVVPAAVARPGEIAVDMPADASDAQRDALLWARARAPVVVWFRAGEESHPERALRQAMALEQSGAGACFTRTVPAPNASDKVVRVSPFHALGGVCWLGSLAVRRAAVSTVPMPDGARSGFQTVLAALLCCGSRAVLVDSGLVQASGLAATTSAHEGVVAGLLQERLVALEVLSSLDPSSPYHDRFHTPVVSILIASAFRYATQWTRSRNQALTALGAPSWRSDARAARRGSAVAGYDRTDDDG